MTTVTVSERAAKAAEAFMDAHGWLCEEEWRQIHPNDQDVIVKAFARFEAEIREECAAVERGAIVSFLREQEDIGAGLGLQREKGSTARAAYGGGSLALKRVADAIERGEHIEAIRQKGQP